MATERTLVLPTSNGSLELSEAAFAGRCASGCRTMGGGLLFVRALRSDGSLNGGMTFCGNCVARGLVGAIDAVQGLRSVEELSEGSGDR